MTAVENRTDRQSTPTDPTVRPDELPLGARINRGLESLTEQVEHSSVLSSVGKALTTPVARLLPPGKVRDLLSGTWLGHPAHPMLTDIPIGAWTSATLLDLWEMMSRSNGASRRASDALIVLGVAAALPTAASGLSDLSDEVEDRTLAAGGAHAVASIAATSLFALSAIARYRGKRAQGVALSLIGTIALDAAGFLGGHLSYRKGLGVDQNAFGAPVADWTAALAVDQLDRGTPHHVVVGDHDILVYRAGEAIYAVANRCSHRGGPLHEGEIDGQEVVCPWHLSRFDLRDGSVTRGPAVAPQPCYDTRVRNGMVEVRSTVTHPSQ